jgi:hypothetical protein
MRAIRSLALAMTLATALVAGACTGAPEPDPPPADIPGFSHGTPITNPYLPLAQGGRWIYEGTREGKPYLVEIAVARATGTVEWAGTSTDATIVRRRSWSSGVLIEEAHERYAQADDGGVWSFGRDVDLFRDGERVDDGRSWLASDAGTPPALVMPADPRIGRVFTMMDPGAADGTERFEVVTLTESVDTPDGHVNNGLLLVSDAGERKVFVPSVGEVLARGDHGELRLVERLEDNAESAAAVKFSQPTTVDNPYFGVTGIDYRLYFGEDEGEPLRIEVAPTGEIKTVNWAGGSTETVVSQFIATSERDLLEIAVDWFAQDDAGNVWYFGEDVWNYEEGRVADMHGTWIAGADGPPGMIMPGDPSLGMRFNPENIPGLVFETVAVRSMNETYGLPAGPLVADVLVLHETLDDGTEETKFYAAGYGNVNVRVPGVESVDIVYALPNDAIDAPRPAELQSLLDGLRTLSMRGNGEGGGLRPALETFIARGDAVPAILIRRAGAQLDELGRLMSRGDRSQIRTSAMDLEQTVLDIARLYRADPTVDLEVLDLLARRMLVAAHADDQVAAATAAALAKGVADRNSNSLTAPAAEAAAAADAAAKSGDLAGIVRAARELRAALD